MSEVMPQCDRKSATSVIPISSNMPGICIVVSVALSVLFAPTSAVFKPSIATVQPGDSQMFTCFSRYSGVDFKFRATGSSIAVLVYSQVIGGVDPKYATKYMVNSTNGDYNIQVRNASSADAGTYTCDGDTEVEEAELVVLAPDTTSCVTNTSSPETTAEQCVTEFRFECSVGFHGNVPPDIEFWNASGGQTIGPIRPTEQNVEFSVSRNVLTQNLSSSSSNSHFLCRVGNRKENDLPVQTICTSEEIPPSCDTKVDRGTKTNVVAIVLPIVLGLCVVLLLIVLLALWKGRRQKLVHLRQEELPLAATNGGTIEEVMLLTETPGILRPSSTTSKLEELIELLSDGGYYEVYKARHSEYGTVSFKKRCLDRMSDECGDKFRKEADGARQLSHQNIVKFRDIIFENAEESSTGTYGIVYEYLENVNLSDFIEMFPLDWNQKLSLISDVASGMKYLHSGTPQIIHGDLRIENILMGFNFKAKVSDFSFAQWKLYSQSHSKRKVGYETIVPYPPEFVSGPAPTNKKLPSFDVYSFGILCWETLTQRKPFAGIVITAILARWIENGKRPDEKLIPGEVPQSCKTLMNNCWSQNIGDRPTFNDINEILRKEVTLFNFSNISGKDSTIDKVKLKELKPLPDGCYLNGFKAKHSEFGAVVYKELFLAGISLEDFNAMQSEAETICHLNHPNLVRMLSLVSSGNKTYGFFTFFHENGNLLEYLRKTKSPWIKRLSLLHDVACGMRYIHGQTPVIIHGDLKIENVLVSLIRGIPIAKICDFGLPRWKACSQVSSERNNVRFGTLAITPPEHLVNPDLHKDTKYDVFSFGILMYQAITLQKPFEEANANIVITWVIKGSRPVVDKDTLLDGVTKTSLELMENCWRQKKGERPDFESITEDLRREMKSSNLFKANNVRLIEHVQYGKENIKRSDGFFAIITTDHEQLGRITIKRPNVKVLKYKHIERLAKEASSYQRLNHRNVVRFLGVVVESPSIEGIIIQPEIYCLVFEHAGENTLAEYLRKNKLSWDQKLPLVLDVASGMEYLHACQPPVTHGNLKMDNVFIKTEGQTVVAKVFNFGFSLENERNSSASIAHFPPENLENPHHPKQESFDVYGFAILLWQIMTPKQMLPFSKELSEETSKEIYDLVLHDKIRPGLENLKSDVSTTCISLMQRCWSSSEQDRPHFKEIAEVLKTAKSSAGPLNNNSVLIPGHT